MAHLNPPDCLLSSVWPPGVFMAFPLPADLLRSRWAWWEVDSAASAAAAAASAALITTGYKCWLYRGGEADYSSITWCSFFFFSHPLYSIFFFFFFGLCVFLSPDASFCSCLSVNERASSQRENFLLPPKCALPSRCRLYYPFPEEGGREVLRLPSFPSQFPSLPFLPPSVHNTLLSRLHCTVTPPPPEEGT